MISGALLSSLQSTRNLKNNKTTRQVIHLFDLIGPTYIF